MQELNGQFAFAIWDRKKETLLLGRDRLGPALFYYHENGRILFGSEMKAIFADPLCAAPEPMLRLRIRSVAGPPRFRYAF